MPLQTAQTEDLDPFSSRQGDFLPHYQAVVLVILCALMTANLLNTPNLPMDFHEIFVARTVEETLDRGDWLVPIYNEVPRINKPPLMYWLVMTIDQVYGDGGRVPAFEARLPSALAAIGLALATFALGRTLVNQRLGLLAAIMLCASPGFASYAHNARPDMLYAALCTAGLLAFIKAYKRIHSPEEEPPATHDDPQPAQASTNTMRPALTGWLCMVLATLTKGPMMPILFIAVMALWLWSNGHGRSINRIFRLPIGLPIYLTGSIWWYLILPAKGIPLLPSLSAEMAERIDERGFDFIDWLEPFFLYKTILLILPWVLFYFFSFFMLRSHRIKPNAGMRLIWWVGIATLIFWQLIPERRLQYAMPMLGLWSVVMAAVAWDLAAELLSRRQPGLLRLAVIVHALIYVTVVVSAHLWVNPLVSLPLGLTILTIAVIFAMLIWMLRQPTTAQHAVLTLAMMGLVMMVPVVLHATIWDTERHHHRAAALQTGAHVPPDARLYGWHYDFDYAQYYLNRTIYPVNSLEDIEKYLPRDNPMYILAPRNRLPAGTWHIEELLTTDPTGENEPADWITLYRVKPLQERPN